MSEATGDSLSTANAMRSNSMRMGKSKEERAPGTWKEMIIVEYFGTHKESDAMSSDRGRNWDRYFWKN
jgi:hypothetical protein